MPERAAIYVRISSDPTGLKAGVDRQEADCRALVRNKGWQVSQVYVDNDTSAWSGEHRPAYRQMLDDIKTGLVDAVVVWHLDRLHRHPRELEEFFEVCDASALRRMASVSGDIDLGTDDGRFQARILGAVARKESDDKSRRIRRAEEEKAARGLPTGGGKRPFGYEEDRITVREEEASLIREAASRLLSGESMNSVLLDWERRGIKTAWGNPWGRYGFKRMITSPRIAGLREHRGEVVGQAIWEPIIDEATHQRLLATLNDPTRKRNSRGRSYLLTGGLSVCGKCGSPLWARPRAGKRRYGCPSGPALPGCGGVSCHADPLEELVREAVFEALSSAKLLQALRSQESHGDLGEMMAKIHRIEVRLEELAQDHYVEELISKSEYLAARQGLEHRLEEARRELRRASRSDVLSTLPSAEGLIRQAWEDGDLAWRRNLLATVLERVVLNRAAVPGWNFFDPERVDLIWRW